MFHVDKLEFYTYRTCNLQVQVVYWSLYIIGLHKEIKVLKLFHTTQNT